jgi:hypothetical protein
MLDKNKPNEEFECMHMMLEADMYERRSGAHGTYWSIYYDHGNEHVIQEVNTWNQEYAIPRWQTVSGSQYAFSPATVAALPDARLLQAMTYTLLEAGEKVTNPPMVATQDVVRSDVAIYAGGITWVDRDYDEKLGRGAAADEHRREGHAARDRDAAGQRAACSRRLLPQQAACRSAGRR